MNCDQHPTDPDNSSLLPVHMVPSEPLAANFAGEKRIVRDIGARMRQIAGLKPGSSSRRTPEMISEIISRLRSGEALLSICSDTHIAGQSTVYDWMDADSELDAAISAAQARGMDVLFDAQMDVALGGAFSTGDRLRDEMVVKAINNVASKRNRDKFGDKVSIDATIGIPSVTLPTIALPSIPPADYTEIDPDNQAS